MLQTKVQDTTPEGGLSAMEISNLLDKDSK